jgi:lipopolysaccharide transport system ATP-binding protein
MQPAIKIEDLHKTFRLFHETTTLKATLVSFGRRRVERLEVLSGISLQVNQGESLAIIGRNGAGKTTLLGLIAGIYKPTSGTIETQGRPATLLELGAGFHPELTGIENIYFSAAIMGLPKPLIEKRLDRIIEFAELEHFADSALRNYSSGMIMRLGFAIVVETDPDILLIDEVIAVGDEAFQRKCYDRIREFQREGKTIVFVSHDLEAVRRFATRAVWLSDARIASEGDPGKVVSEYLVYSGAQVE